MIISFTYCMTDSDVFLNFYVSKNSVNALTKLNEMHTVN